MTGPDQRPSVGRIVHYVSYGTPGGEYDSTCRAAIIAGLPDPEYTDSLVELTDLAVLNPTGLFFNRCRHDEDAKSGGTWHWPERVE
jgi:hypothetical protein